MTFEEFKQSLSWQELKAVFNCTNCECDIIAKGKWTGYGWQYLSELIKKHPNDKKLRIIYKVLKSSK